MEEMWRESEGVTGVGCCRCSSAAWGQEEGYDGYS